MLNTFSGSKRLAPLVAKQVQMMNVGQQRSFADQLEVKKAEETAINIDEQNKRLGIDMAFSE